MEQKHNQPTELINTIKMLYDSNLAAQARSLEEKYGINIFAIEQNLMKFITVDKDCLEVKNQIRILANHDDAVLIQGETGTGKELLANALHGNRKGKFIAINCAGMPKDLMESELFGYDEGSFTGAKKGGNTGLVAAAQDGTMFLDEVGDLPLDLQAKLLRVLQEKTVRPVGAKEEKDINVRFVAATHINLYNAVGSNQFRKDLYARLSTFLIQIKPLKMRLCDIPEIVKSLDPQGTFPCESINWPQVNLDLNVRAVQQIVRRYQVFGTLPLQVKENE